MSADFENLKRCVSAGQATVGIIGLGYVGLPLACVFIDCGFRCIGFDIDPTKVDALSRGESYIGHIADERVRALDASGRFEATNDFDKLVEVDATLICVPTPLDGKREPDLSFVVATSEEIAKRLRPGQIVVLESTTYPGTCDQVVRPILETSGLRSELDFLLAYSPEREDPGNAEFSTARIPKVVGGDGVLALEVACALYGRIVPQVIPVSSTSAAEAVKITENVFRAVNIALVNELKGIYGELGIDIWEVIEAAESKPFGFMPFYPGPGLGGHCIPIDPFYLAWKASQHGMSTRFIELAGEINSKMPGLVVEALEGALQERFGASLDGAKILLLGAAYKKNVDDVRESPSFVLWELMTAKGAEVDFHDPHVAVLPRTREFPDLAGRASVELTADRLAASDAILICTDHDSVDYSFVVRHARLVVDTRNATAHASHDREKIVRA